jgi:hypothetical protein
MLCYTGAFIFTSLLKVFATNFLFFKTRRWRLFTKEMIPAVLYHHQNRIESFLRFVFSYGSISYRVLVGKPEGKRPLERPRRRWEDNIKMVLRDVGWEAWTGSIWLTIETGGGLL